MTVREDIEGAHERDDAEAAHREFARRFGGDV